MSVPTAFNVLAKLTRQTSNAPVTGALSPTAGGKIWHIVASTGSANSEKIPTVTTTIPGQSAWTTEATVDPGVSTKVGLHIQSSITGATPGTAGTITTTFQGGSTPTDSTIIILETPSNYGATVGVTASPVNSGTSPSPSVLLSATPTTNDRTVGFVASRNTNLNATPGGSFNQVDEFHGTSPVAMLFIEDLGGNTNTTVSATNAGSIAVDMTAFIIQGSASGPVANQTDDGGLTDSVSISMVRGQTNTDDAGITDSSTLVFNRGQINTDDAGLTDSATAQIQHNVAQTDSAGLTDSATVALVHNVTQTDDSGLTDSTVLSFIRGVSQTDLVGLTDSSTATVFPPPSATTTDIVGLTDSFVVVIVHGGLVAGTIMDQIMADLISRGYLVGTVLDREYKRLVDATGVPNGGAGKTIDDLYALNNERNRVALESVAIIPKT
jgi:hypothetical protein